MTGLIGSGVHAPASNGAALLDGLRLSNRFVASLHLCLNGVDLDVKNIVHPKN
jgi:hypothetical protein